MARNEQKWTDQRPAKKHKSSSRESPRSCTPETNESHLGDEEQGPSHTSPKKGRPIGKKKEKDRRGKNLVAHGENLYMEAMENMWLKREKAEELREIRKKERNDQRLAVETRKLELKQEVDNRKLDLKQRELQLKQRQDDEKVMNMDLSSLSERQQIFYKTMQDQIIARLGGGAL
ncbi:unnamed protein product [Miscanthus lutarioriparius]|uniref:No apical meristem-associated C-terminal domain-containing protein n=1 Tax=Miscanthus lutarioriparius TaxID=422564 RepID=A0A811PU42_9POAL|nr:unnamed protein product [Miscanthus lutarioriparius]